MSEKRYLNLLKTAPESLDGDSRELTAIVSTNDVDRDGEIVEPGAFKDRIASFMDNPVFLWAHDHFNPPIGKALGIEFKENGMEARLKFRKAGESVLADDVFSLFQQGILRTFSIGFRVHKMELEEDDAGKSLPPRITDAELFEVSAVAIPANPHAVAKMLSQCQLLTEGKAPASITDSKFVTDPVPVKSITVYSAPSDEEILAKSCEIVDAFFDRCLKGGQAVGAEWKLITNLRVALLGTQSPEQGDPNVKALEDLSGHLRELLTTKELN